jgi:hypothetical protein
MQPESVPGWDAGRAFPGIFAAGSLKRFNPRPAIASRAIRKLTSSRVDAEMMLSAHGWEAGRFPAPAGAPKVRKSFQSAAPGWEAGRFRRRGHHPEAARVFQSAPGWEAGRFGHALGYRDGRDEFQSAPGWEAGRFKARPGQAADNGRVSIRARLGSRAIPEEYVQIVGISTFQSAPGWEAGRFTPICCSPASAYMFQSAPGWEAGRF